MKTLAIILITIAFCSLQAGRIAGYYLCKLQSITTQEVSCDCNNYLTDKHAQHHSGMTHLKEKPADHIVSFIAIQFTFSDPLRKKGVVYQDHSLEKGFVKDCFRPPSFRLHTAI